MKSEKTECETDAVFGHYGFQASHHVAIRLSYTLVMPNENNRCLVQYGRKHVVGEQYMTDAQVIAHLAAMVLAGLGDGLVQNPDWI